MNRRTFLKLGIGIGSSFVVCEVQKEKDKTVGTLGLLGLLQPNRGCIDPSKNPSFEMSEDSQYRYFKTNGLPNHQTGEFPSEGDPFLVCSNASFYRVPKNPTTPSVEKKAGKYIFGIALNGVVFDPAGPFWKKDSNTGWEFHPADTKLMKDFGVDFNNAHTQPTDPFSSNGLYHYHGLPVGLIEKFSESSPGSKSFLIGYAADGYPIYNNYGLVDPNNILSGYKAIKSSYRLKSGARKSGEPSGNYDGTFIQDYEYVNGLGDLDIYNGRFGVTQEFPSGIYHYYINSAFPHVPFIFKGEPDESFKQKGPDNSQAEVPPRLSNWPAA